MITVDKDGAVALLKAQIASEPDKTARCTYVTTDDGLVANPTFRPECIAGRVLAGLGVTIDELYDVNSTGFGQMFGPIPAAYTASLAAPIYEKVSFTPEAIDLIDQAQKLQDGRHVKSDDPVKWGDLPNYLPDLA